MVSTVVAVGIDYLHRPVRVNLAIVHIHPNFVEESMDLFRSPSQEVCKEHEAHCLEGVLHVLVDPRTWKLFDMVSIRKALALLVWWSLTDGLPLLILGPSVGGPHGVNLDDVHKAGVDELLLVKVAAEG